MAYQHEREGRARARALVAKAGYGKTGGHFKKGGETASDHASDVKMIRSAINQHDSQLHGGKTTRLKLADGGIADGPMSMSRSDKSPRGKAKKNHGTNVNVIVAGGGGQDRPVPVPVPAPPAAMPPHPMPVAPPAGPPPGAMAGPPPGVAMPPRPPMMPPPGAAAGLPMRKHGGRTPKHDSEIAREAKEEGESYKEEAAEHGKRKAGGRSYSPPKMSAGSDTGEGRLEKARLC